MSTSCWAPTPCVGGQAVTPQEAERVQKIVEASAKDFKALSMVTYAGERLSPEALATLIGETSDRPTRSNLSKGGRLVVEGMARMRRVSAREDLLAAFDKDADDRGPHHDPAEPQVSLDERIKDAAGLARRSDQGRALENRAIVVGARCPPPKMPLTPARSLRPSGNRSR